MATKVFAKENIIRSWIETCVTLILLISVFMVNFWSTLLPLRCIMGIMTALLYVRMFVIYHDYHHHAILQKSIIAKYLMNCFGIFILIPPNIWKRSHDHHHNHNSKLVITGIGSYPTISKEMFIALSTKDRRLYLINRHPFTIFLGYFTLFIYWLNIKSFVQAPKKHWDSALCLIIHLAIGCWIWTNLGILNFSLAWFFPFFLALATGSYLFYSQHNFPAAKFKENKSWSYDHAALYSSSYMIMPAILNWFTGNIGFHHVHHLNAKIPFYRLKEAMDNIPELQLSPTTSFHPREVWRCLQLKLWDHDQDKMITLKELNNSYSPCR